MPVSLGAIYGLPVNWDTLFSVLEGPMNMLFQFTPFIVGILTIMIAFRIVPNLITHITNG